MKVKQLFLLFMIIIFVVGCSEEGVNDIYPTQAQNNLSKELKIIIPKNIENIDPVSYQNGNGAALLYNFLFEGLVKYDHETQTIIPLLAEKYTVSSDYRVYNFYLRKSIVAHNNQKVGAEDVKLSWERAYNSGNPEVKQILSEISNFSNIGITGIKIIDNYTLEISLRKPDRSFLNKITHPALSILSLNKNKDTQEQSKTEEERIPEETTGEIYRLGTGKYELIDKNEDYGLSLRPFGKYYQKKDEYDYVNINTVNKTDLQISSFQKGEADIAYLDSAIPDFISNDDPSLKRMLREDYSTESVSLVFNMKKPIYNDQNLREIIAYSLNRNKLAQIAKEFRVAKGLLPRKLINNIQSNTAYNLDLEKAKNLAITSGYSAEGQKPLVLYYLDVDLNKKLCEEIKGQLNAVGLKINLQKIDSVENFIYGINSGSIDFYLNTLGIDIFSPSFYLENYFLSSSLGNMTGFTDSNFDNLISEIEQLDPKDRAYQEKVLEAEAIIMKINPIISLLEKRSVSLVRENLNIANE